MAALASNWCARQDSNLHCARSERAACRVGLLALECCVLKMSKGQRRRSCQRSRPCNRDFRALRSETPLASPIRSSHTGAAVILRTSDSKGRQPSIRGEGGWVQTFAITPAAQQGERLNRHTRPILDAHDVKQPSLRGYEQVLFGHEQHSLGLHCISRVVGVWSRAGMAVLQSRLRRLPDQL
jgi:hypothetical protein